MKQNKVYSLVLMGLAIVVLVVVSVYRNTQQKNLSIARENELTPKNNPSAELSSKSVTLKEIIKNRLEKKNEMFERVDFNNSVVNLDRVYTEAEIENMTEVEFETLLKDVFLKLPKLSDIKNLPPEALHRTPPPVLQAGRDLGLVVEIVNIHEDFAKKTHPYYDQCSRNSEHPVPVRALCLTNLILSKKKLGLKVNTKEYSPEVLNLARMVTDL